MTKKSPPYTVVQHDTELLVLAKASGVSVDEVLLHLRAEVATAALVHRLDKDTSGLLLVARTAAVKELLQAQFKARLVRKEYLAVLDGNLARDYVNIESYLSRHRDKRMQMQSHAAPVPGRNCRYAASEFFVLRRFQQRLNLVKVSISTGRTHQIRVHAAKLGVPVLGDRLYHRPAQLPQTFPAGLRTTLQTLPGQLLHANYLEFKHPRTHTVQRCTLPPPADFAMLLNALEAI